MLVESGHRVWFAGLLCCIFAMVSEETSSRQRQWTFRHAAVGKVPKGWQCGVTGARTGTAPRWKVVDDAGRHVLAQTESGGANGDFPVCLKTGTSFHNGTVSIRFKPISGRIDQAGGVVFRAADKDNFYIVRANALENNVSFYVTRGARRKTIKYWEKIRVDRGAWHELKVTVHDNEFRVWFDGKYVGMARDPNATWQRPGMVGLWTKADSVTYFDRLAVEPE